MAMRRLVFIQTGPWWSRVRVGYYVAAKAVEPISVVSSKASIPIAGRK